VRHKPKSLEKASNKLNEMNIEFIQNSVLSGYRLLSKIKGYMFWSSAFLPTSFAPTQPN